MERSRRDGAMRGAALALCLGVAVLSTGQPAAQGFVTRPSEQPLDAQETMKLTLRQALDLIRLGRAEQAVALLETLHREHPTEISVTLSLAEAYAAAGRHLDEAAIYRAEATQRGREDPSLWIQLAHAYQRAGQGKAAVEALLECSRQQPDWAIQLLDSFQLLAADSLVGAEARATLEAAVRAGEGPPAWTEILAHARALAGEGQKALALMARLERQSRGDGRRLFELSKTLWRGDQRDAAVAALDSVLVLPLRGDSAGQALLEKARLLEMQGRAREAAATYADAEQRVGDGPVALRATLMRARLLLTVGDVAGAREAYGKVGERVAQRPRRDQRALHDEARLGLAECALRQGELARADSLWAEIAEKGSSATAREQAAFERAELLFYQGRFPDAEEAYYKLTDQYPSGDWTNDALQRVLLLGESATVAQALGPLAHALYQRRVGKTDEALALCTQGLGQYDSTTVGAELRRLEIQLLGDAGRWVEADSSLARLRARHPSGRAVPAALLWMAERAEATAERRARAQAYYERIVLQYPDSFEARRARTWLQARRSAGATS